uniref:hypothetical protein n=1 Tax=Thaumasiovibrio occultus TaxID=1891184 RepID=UPI000B350C41|nr:hypothetical protein [Thaumasiovibrio occultus]
MKKMSSSYRLQIIREVAQRRKTVQSVDEMTIHIQQLLDSQRNSSLPQSTVFEDAHYDQNAGGWVSDLWGNDSK